MAGLQRTLAMAVTALCLFWGGYETAYAQTSPLLPFKGEATAEGRSHTCAIDYDDTAWCWGKGGSGQLGNSLTADQTTPVRVSNLGAVKQISAGSDHTCAIDANDKAWCWGWGGWGQLGNGSTASQTRPVAVSDLGTAKQISAGSDHTCAIDANNNAWCWGQGGNGQMGNGSTASQTRPVAVSNLGTAKQISAGSDHTCAIDANNKAWCWGFGGRGQLGNGSTAKQSTPVAVSNLGWVKQISAGGFHTCAIDVNNKAWCWGQGDSGQMGNGSTVNKATPVAVSNLGWVRQISAGGWHTCAIDYDDTAWCWGKGGSGQLGNSLTADQTKPVRVDGTAQYVVTLQMQAVATALNAYALALAIALAEANEQTDGSCDAGLLDADCHAKTAMDAYAQALAIVLAQVNEQTDGACAAGLLDTDCHAKTAMDAYVQALAIVLAQADEQTDGSCDTGLTDADCYRDLGASILNYIVAQANKAEAEALEALGCDSASSSVRCVEAKRRAAVTYFEHTVVNAGDINGDGEVTHADGVEIARAVSAMLDPVTDRFRQADGYCGESQPSSQSSDPDCVSSYWSGVIRGKVMEHDPNGDGSIDAQDLAYVRAQLENTVQDTLVNGGADLNNDGTVNVADVTFLLSPVIQQLPGVHTIDQDGDGDFDGDDIELIADQAPGVPSNFDNYRGQFGSGGSDASSELLYITGNGLIDSLNALVAGDPVVSVREAAQMYLDVMHADNYPLGDGTVHEMATLPAEVILENIE